MDYLRGFIAWIAFAVVSSYSLQWGAVAGLAVGVGVLAKELRSGTRAEALVLEGSGALFFAVLTGLAFAFPRGPLAEYSGALSLAWLAVTAWGTVAVRRPFTTGIAKRQAPPAVWETPLFRRINTVLTSAWATAFTVTAGGVAAVHAAGVGGGIPVLCQIAGFVLPMLFTGQYLKKVRARQAAHAVR
ncbi:hypothetical protein I5Q34_02915 [Streptomyces sp. AV19]|uniref:hypothetical protein n=1 Tax=Streptomyces sp. AV19 TaxID=2793068 RepID=UPI0018FEB0C6|nr:hypothetical protein [Streptomyces sp. AV19]MBH1933249.1 hypothetical protein [Streptomyces sp. AV19]MDG4530652.1 hypothetical protein [Streptomyces sp. AV19]